MILSQLLLRVDPQHRSISQWVAQEIALPLGLTDSLQIGVSVELQQQGISHIADTVPTGPPMSPVPPWSLPEAGGVGAPELVRPLNP